MDKAMIVVVIVYWLTSTIYVIRHEYKNGEKAFGVVLAALLLGPIVSIFINGVKDDTEEDDMKEHTTNNIPNFRTVPPPPPKPQHKKDFKFFQK